MANFEDLGIPAWVQAAWSQPPRKDEILFRPVKPGEGNRDDCEMNAVIRKADDYAYSEGYRLAGRILADYVIQKPLEADFLVYPILFLYRHYVELQLKRLIPMGAQLANQVISKADRGLLQSSHRLDHLWARFEPILRKVAKTAFKVPSADIGGIGSYVRQLHEIDEGSFSARYALTRSGQPSINNERHPALNIGVIAEGMEKLTAYLFGLGEAFHEAYQVKCQMEDEARADAS